MTETAPVVYEISALQAWLVIIAGLLLSVGLGWIWFSKSKVKYPKLAGQKQKYLTNGQVCQQQLLNMIIRWRIKRTKRACPADAKLSPTKQPPQKPE